VSRALAGLLAMGILLPGCAIGASREEARPETNQLPRELGGESEPLPLADVPTPPPGASPEEKEDEEEGGRATSSPGGSSAPGGDITPDQAPTSRPKPPAWTLSGRALDGPDVPSSGPTYTDLEWATVERRAGRARVTVKLEYPVPRRLQEGEVMGIGVDFFRSGGSESDYQLFADGSSDGWFAYLHTPGGLVRYPGRFRVGSGAIVFELPWRSLGGPRPGRFSAFLDWSQQAPVRSRSASDRVPNTGRATLDP
jgi:hypothetical protein